MLQDWDKVPFPEQEAPPLAGAGSEHVRVRLCVPDPQVAEQEVQDPHNAQFPFTDKIDIQYCSLQKMASLFCLTLLGGHAEICKIYVHVTNDNY